MFVYRSVIRRILFLLLVFCLPGPLASGQAIDNMASFRMIDAKKYIRFHYENDYFTATDYYYTQGMNLEVVDPSYHKFPLSKLLIVSNSGKNQYGISLEHNGYTPTSIESNTILYGDRPFAAALMLKTFAMSCDSLSRFRVTSSLSLGVIGPAAKGYQMQKTIHGWINATEPLGWQYQIQNDAIVNYEVGIEQSFVQFRRNTILINGFANGRLGTLNTKLSTGFVIMFGDLNSAIRSVFIRSSRLDPLIQKKKVSVRFYGQPMINLVGYDATLQGGLFNKSSPYTISAGEIERITFQANYGLVIEFHALYIEYFKTIISKEFETGLYHRWGGIRIGVKL